MSVDYEAVLAKIDNEKCEKCEVVQYELPLDKEDVIVRPVKFDLVNTPQFDISVIKSKLGVSEVQDVVAQCDDFVVDTDEKAIKGVTLAMKARKVSSDITKARRRLTEPALLFQRNLIKVEKEYIGKLKDVEKELITKVEAYQDKRREALEELNIVDDSIDNISVDEASSHVVSEWTYTIEDTNEIPIEYMSPNTRAINESIKNGVREIPGLRIYHKQKRRYRRK